MADDATPIASLSNALAALPAEDVAAAAQSAAPQRDNSVAGMVAANRDAAAQQAPSDAQQPPVQSHAAPEEPPPADEDDGGKGWLEDMLHDFAPRLSGKYASPEEFFKGVDNLASKLGEKGSYEDIGRLAVNDPHAALDIIRQYLPDGGENRGTDANAQQPTAQQPQQQQPSAGDATDQTLSEHDYLMRRRPEFKAKWLDERDSEGKLLPHVADKVASFHRWNAEFEAFKLEHPELDEKLAIRRLQAIVPRSNPAESQEVEQLRSRLQQMEQHSAAVTFNSVLNAIVHHEHTALPEDQRWMYQPGTPPHEYGRPDKLSPAGQAFWQDLNRRYSEASRTGIPFDWGNGVTDAKLRAKATMRDQADRAQARRAPPKSNQRQQPSSHGDPSGSTHAPSQPTAREFPKGKSLEQALLEAAKDDGDFRRKFRL